MLFNSVQFLLLLGCTFLLYYLPAIKKWQVFILILASLIFYSFQNPYLLLLLLTSATATYYFTYKIFNAENCHKRKWAIAGVIFNLAILLFFKYSGFLTSIITGSENDLTHFLISIPLPIGISFYTFHGISMLIDAYKKGGTEKWGDKFNFPNSLLYTIFFPQLIAGPILRAKYFIPQIHIHELKNIPWNFCFRHLLIGYFLKMVIADNLKDQTAYFSEDYLLVSLSTITSIVLLFGYACQIFSDFAGYSYIARGLAALFGYKIIMNFNYPYIASGFSDLWRRWNISLSQFMKQYLYIPLGGNRVRTTRIYFNLFITMALAGLWHGASIGYLLWGIYHGLFLCFERVFKELGLRILSKTLKRIFVFLIVTLGWVFFLFPEKERFLLFFSSIFRNTHLPLHYAPTYFTILYCLPILLFHVYGFYKERNKIIPQNWKVAAYSGMLFLIIWNSGTAGRFIYFQF